jgi:hypothetical protein
MSEAQKNRSVKGMDFCRAMKLYLICHGRVLDLVTMFVLGGVEFFYHAFVKPVFVHGDFAFDYGTNIDRTFHFRNIV